MMIDSLFKSKLLKEARLENWGEVERLVGLPNPCGPHSEKEYKEQFKRVARCFAYATHDESWHEFEKEFAIIIKRMLQAECELKRLKRVEFIPPV